MTGEGQQEHGVENAERICEGQMYYTAWRRRPSKAEKHRKHKGRLRKRLKLIELELLGRKIIMKKIYYYYY